MIACPFCSLDAARVIDQNAHCVAIRDAFPIAVGHTLIIPRRHVGSLFDLSAEEAGNVFELLVRARQELQVAFAPDGFNVGVNDGRAAGQTVPHLHVHLIPRYTGDVADPRGGVRWIFPDKADYWSER